MKNKRGFLVSKETVELIIAVAIIALVIFVLYNVLIGSWNKEDETAKSYLETLKKEIAKADAGGVGEFEMWQKTDETYLVAYFGDKVGMKIGKFDLIPDKAQKNNLCICYSSGSKVLCKPCVSLKYPVRFDGFPEETFIQFGQKVKITKSKDKGEYVFILQKDSTKKVEEPITPPSEGSDISGGGGGEGW